MELRQLEYLVAVAEEANFTRAAQRVRISQPGVSAQIRLLERELAATLIDRSARTARLTEAGVAAVGHARAVLASAASLRQAVGEVTGLLRGRLVIGMVTSCTITPLFDALAAFHRAHPGVQITLLESDSAALAGQVQAGTADLALIGAASTPPPGLESLTIISERLVAVVPPAHPLTAQPGATLAGLAVHPVICMPRGTGVRTVLDQACAAAGIQLNIALEASAPAAIADLAARGLGAAVLSETIAAALGATAAAPRTAPNAAGAALRSMLIDDVTIPALLALVWKPPTPASPSAPARAVRSPAAPGSPAAPSPAVREFLRHARAAFGRP